MAYSSESSAQEYATTISQLIISVNQTHSGRHQLLAVVERISVGIFRKGAFGLMDIPGWRWQSMDKRCLVRRRVGYGYP